MDNITHVGLDVHEESISIGVAVPGRGAAERYGSIDNDERSVGRMLRELRKRVNGVGELHFCYEAGPCGYGLYRYLRGKGESCAVVAPSLIPKKPGEKVKTDRRDANKLARLSRAGELTEVWVPDAQQEALRDLTRAREDARLACKRGKQNLGAFLRRYGRRYPGKSFWTQKFYRWLETLKFDFGVQHIVLQDYIDAVQRAQERIESLEEQMRLEFEQWEWKPVGQALMSLRGIDLVTAMSILTELGDLRRFETPRQLMGYLGLVPSEYSTGKNRRVGAITKAGNSHVRRLLIEAAWCARLKPCKSQHWRKRAKDASQAVQGIAWKAMKKLNHRYWLLSNRRVKQPKIITAVARELAGFVWAVAQQAYVEQQSCAA